MCNLYSLSKPRNQISFAFGIGDNQAEAFDPRDAIFPGHSAPIIRRTAEGARELILASWGFVLPQPGRAPRRVTNARDDKVLSSRFWAESFALRRCLVPATSYCEPNGQTPASWFWFAMAGEDPRPVFAFPGLWRRWVGPIKKDGPAVDLIVYAFLTTEPNALTIGINHERMPVLLTEERDYETWLSGSSREAFELVRSLSPERMRIVQSGLDKKDLLSSAA